MEELRVKKENNNMRFSSEQLKQMQKQGWVDEQGNITSQSISILACLEADKLYQGISFYYPNAMQVVSRYAERFLNEQNFSALLSLLRESYGLAGLEEPEYINDLYTKSTATVIFLQELTDDWIDCALQEVD